MTDHSELSMRSKKAHPRLFPGTLGIVKVVAPLDQTREVIRAVETAGYIQPIEVDPRPGFNQMEIEQRRVTFENYRSELQNLINNIEEYIEKPKEKIEVPSDIDGIKEYVENILKNEGKIIKDLLEEKNNLTNRVNELEDLKELLEKFQKLGLDSRLLGYKQNYTRIFVGSIFKDQLETLNAYVMEVTDGRYVLINNDPRIADKSGNIEFMVIVFSEDAEAVETVLKDLNYEPIKLPDDKTQTAKLDIDDVEHELKEKLDEINKIDSDNGKLQQKAQEVGYKLLAALEICNIELNRIEVEFKMRRTQSTCIMWGWIPPDKFNQFKSLVITFTGGSAVVEYRDAFDRKFMPSYVQDKPKRLFPPVRNLVTSFGTPSTKEIDPYIFVGPLFIIFFAIMFADVMHGLLLMGLGFFARYYRNQSGKDSSGGLMGYVYNGADLMIWMGIFSAIGGLFLGSFFGDETFLWDFDILVSLFGRIWKFFYLLKPVVEEGHTVLEIERNYKNFLLLSFGFGAGTIILGLLLKVYQQLYYRHTNYELYGTISLITLYVSGILALVSGVGLLGSQILFFIFIGLVAFGLFGVIFFEGKAHGFDGAMEAIDHILALLSNTFSFGRLLAMNTIHFVFAFLPYLAFDLLFGTHTLNHEVGHWRENVVGSGSFIPWLIAALIGSIIVLLIETVFSTLQALRLTWVEFFGKFYKGEGIKFEPVKVERTLTIE